MTTVSIAGTAAGPELATLQLKIGGMSCSFCANSIEKALRREKGVNEVHVSLAHEEALIRFRAGETPPPVWRLRAGCAHSGGQASSGESTGP